MDIFVLLYNSGTDKEGIHSIELKGRTIVLMFEDKDDATRYCGLLEAQDFPLPTVEMINIEEIKEFCIKLDYEYPTTSPEEPPPVKLHQDIETIIELSPDEALNGASILISPTSVANYAVVIFIF